MVHNLIQSVCHIGSTQSLKLLQDICLQRAVHWNAKSNYGVLIMDEGVHQLVANETQQCAAAITPQTDR